MDISKGVASSSSPLWCLLSPLVPIVVVPGSLPDPDAVEPSDFTSSLSSCSLLYSECPEFKLSLSSNNFLSILYALPLRLDFPDEPIVDVCDPDCGREGGKSVGESDL